MADPVVQLDIAHPNAKASQTHLPTDLYVKWDVVRVHKVTGLTTGVPNQSATALARGLAVQGVPQMGSFAPGAPGAGGAILISYTSQTVAGNDDACWLFGTYSNPLPNAPVAFLASDDTVLSQETTSLHPNGQAPMLFNYTVNKNPVATLPNPTQQAVTGLIEITTTTPDTNSVPVQFPALFSYTRPLRRVVVSGYVITTDIALDPYRNAVGCVNQQTWLGYDPGFWRIDEFRDEGVLLGNIVHVTAAFTSRINENWMQWEVLFSPDIGRRVTVNQADVNALKAKGYFYGWDVRNGIIVAGLHDLKNFGQLFGFGGN